MFYERELAKARELQAQETAKLEELVNNVDLLQATLSKAANDLAAANNNSEAAQQELETRRYVQQQKIQHHPCRQQVQRQCSASSAALPCHCASRNARSLARVCQFDHGCQ